MNADPEADPDPDAVPDPQRDNTVWMLPILPTTVTKKLLLCVCAVPHAAHHRNLLRLLDVDREDHADLGQLFQVKGQCHKIF